MNHFVDKIRTRLKVQLPGFEEQMKMSPLNNRPPVDYTNLLVKRSSVLILFYPYNNQPTFVLTERADGGGVHSGQISFPGGRFEPEDVHYHATALREAHEEIGINSNQVEIMGDLSQLYIPVSNFLVYPVVGYMKQRPHILLSQSEVRSVIEIPLSLLMNEACVKRRSVYVSLVKKELEVPCFEFYGKRVWGATAMMLSELKAVVAESGITSF